MYSADSLNIIDIIIIFDRVRGPHLFTYVCQSDHYLESTVVTFMEQLMTALDWLHQNNIAHLDVKVC